MAYMSKFLIYMASFINSFKSESLKDLTYWTPWFLLPNLIPSVWIEKSKYPFQVSIKKL